MERSYGLTGVNSTRSEEWEAVWPQLGVVAWLPNADAACCHGYHQHDDAMIHVAAIDDFRSVAHVQGAVSGHDGDDSDDGPLARAFSAHGEAASLALSFHARAALARVFRALPVDDGEHLGAWRGAFPVYHSDDDGAGDDGDPMPPYVVANSSMICFVDY